MDGGRRRVSERTLRLALLGALLALPGTLGAQDAPAPASQRPRVTLILNGAFELGSLDFTDSRSFELFEENAQFDARYEVGGERAVEFGRAIHDPDVEVRV